MNTIFLRVLDDDDKAVALLHAAEDVESQGGLRRFEVDPLRFSSVPGSPFAYWITERLRSLFSELPTFEGRGRTARHGAATLDDVRFMRLWFEISPETADWVPFAKGGSRAPYYSDVHCVLRWEDQGAELKANASAVRERNGWGDQWTAVLNGYSYYFRPGLTWPHRSARFSAAALPGGCVFSQSGKAAFATEGDLPTLLGLMNASVITLLCRVQSDAVRIAFETGLVSRTPFPAVDAGDADWLAAKARRAWSLRRSIDTRVETSHAFTLPALLQVSGSSLVERAAAWSVHVAAVADELAAIQREIDERGFNLYELEEEDARAVTEGFGTASPNQEAPAGPRPDEDDEEEETAGSDESAETSDLVAELLSWAVGAAFGRFDVRRATCTREVAPEPEPFQPLPACSPGMLTGSDGLPAARRPEAYPIDWPTHGIRVDDPGHSDDLPSRLREVFDIVFGTAADVWWQDCARSMGGDLRRWLRGSFFEAHLKGNSKSRRKAPIYWQLATPTASYSVWVYAHRASADTLYRVLNDYVAPKLRHEDRKLTGLIQGAGSSPTASQRRDMESQRTFVEELRVFRDGVARGALLWRPELDDGILITCAPLWKLVAQHRVWQRETKVCWDKLAEGNYDWAHLAMRLWPERVVPKCAHDRSLAIAHGLEEEFWAEDADGKWASRQVDGASIERLVQERSSAAVEAALADLVATG